MFDLWCNKTNYWILWVPFGNYPKYTYTFNQGLFEALSALKVFTQIVFLDNFMHQKVARGEDPAKTSFNI